MRRCAPIWSCPTHVCLQAIVRVLETTPHTKKPLLIKTDSKYSISCEASPLRLCVHHSYAIPLRLPALDAEMVKE